jgi:CBS domain-containing protein
MSPRAAWRLEAFGFSAVFDYTTGKVDWLAAGLPTEGRGPVSPRVTLAMKTAVPTCTPDEGAAAALERARAAGWGICVAVNDAGVVQGRVTVGSAMPEGSTVADVMEPGPATVRANEDLAEALARMRKRRVATLLVTTPEGWLLGSLRQPVDGSPDDSDPGSAGDDHR